MGSDVPKREKLSLKMKKCCFCWDLATGSLISAIYTVLTSLILIGVGADKLGSYAKKWTAKEMHIGFYSSLVSVSAVMMVSAFLILHGVSKKSKYFLIPWLLLVLIWTVIAVCALVMLPALYPLEAGVPDDLAPTIVGIVFMTLLNIYALLCVGFFYWELVTTPDDQQVIPIANMLAGGMKDANTKIRQSFRKSKNWTRNQARRISMRKPRNWKDGETTGTPRGSTPGSRSIPRSSAQKYRLEDVPRAGSGSGTPAKDQSKKPDIRSPTSPGSYSESTVRSPQDTSAPGAYRGGPVSGNGYSEVYSARKPSEYDPPPSGSRGQPPMDRYGRVDGRGPEQTRYSQGQGQDYDRRYDDRSQYGQDGRKQGQDQRYNRSPYSRDEPRQDQSYGRSPYGQTDDQRQGQRYERSPHEQSENQRYDTRSRSPYGRRDEQGQGQRYNDRSPYGRDGYEPDSGRSPRYADLSPNREQSTPYTQLNPQSSYGAPGSGSRHQTDPRGYRGSSQPGYRDDRSYGQPRSGDRGQHRQYDGRQPTQQYAPGQDYDGRGRYDQPRRKLMDEESRGNMGGGGAVNMGYTAHEPSETYI